MSTNMLDLSLKTVAYYGLEAGIKLIITGAVHGNEVCGTQAILRVIQEIDQGTLAIKRGQVTFVPITNPLAYQQGTRSGQRNLNRNLRINELPQDFEDKIANQLCPLLKQHEVLLDLHSFQSPGTAFVFLGPENNSGSLEPFAQADAEVALAVRLGLSRLIHGWMETFANGVKNRLLHTPCTGRAAILNTDPAYGVGTTEYMRAHGGYALTVECGQHADPQAPEVGYRAIINTLAHLGLIEQPKPEANKAVEFLKISRVYDRQHPEDKFSKKWVSFDLVTEGETIAVYQNGRQLIAPNSGFIVFPNYDATPGNEWFYLAERSDRVFHCDFE